MNSSELHAVTVRLDVLRDIMIELAAALPPDRAAGFVAALGNRLTGRMVDMEIDERTDDAMLSDLAPVFAALSHQPVDTSANLARPQQSGCSLTRHRLKSTPPRLQNQGVES